MSRTRRAAGLAVVVAIASAVAACGSGAPSATGGKSSTNAGTLMLGAALAAATFNPWLAPDGDNEYLQLEGAVYDSLTHIGPDGQIEPGLAVKWTFTSPTTLMLTLRSGVTFSDGTPVNAAAVKDNFDYVKTASPGAQQNAYIAALTTTVVNATTLKLVSPNPEPDLLTDFATGGGFIVNPKALANPSSLTTRPAGSGPYVLSSSVPGQQWTFSRRGHYWDAAEYPYGKLVLKSFASSQAQDDALRSGQLQGAPETPTLVKSDMASGLRIESSKPEAFDGIWLADRAGKVVPALGNVQVRQALNYAIDRTAIMKAFGSVGIAGSLVMPPGLPGYSAAASAAYSYDPAKARQLLAAAGYPHGFTLPVLSSPVADTLVQAIAGYLRAVGVNVQISDHTTDFLSQAYSGKWGAIVFAWTPIPPSQNMEELLSPAGLGNFDHSTDPQIDALLAKTQQTTGAAQTTALTQLVQAVNTQAWFLIPGYTANLYVTGSHTTCEIGQRSVCPLYTFRPVGK
jgi:peptide/nickel transport system substrate-binding protein